MSAVRPSTLPLIATMSTPSRGRISMSMVLLPLLVFWCCRRQPLGEREDVAARRRGFVFDRVHHLAHQVPAEAAGLALLERGVEVRGGRVQGIERGRFVADHH